MNSVLHSFRLLALEPYYGGSHRAVLDGWQRHSRHQIEILGLPARHWKWRMRHAGLTLARQAEQQVEVLGQTPDALVASSMMDLPQLRGSLPATLARLPIALYFHENQLTHPVAEHQQADLHYGYTNILSAIAADALWFNSAYHRDTFFSAAQSLLRRMPDFRHLEDLDAAHQRSSVLYPGLESPANHRPSASPKPEEPGDAVGEPIHLGGSIRLGWPIRLGWIARWEFDKQPAVFLDALRELRKTGQRFRLTVLSRPTRTTRPLWDRLLDQFAREIDFAGYAESVEDYEQHVQGLDAVISTAAHEFFGIAIAEAALRGVIPVVPRDLAYPELYPDDPPSASFHDGSVRSITHCIQRLAALRQDEAAWHQRRLHCAAAIEPLQWPKQVRRFDLAVGAMLNR